MKTFWKKLVLALGVAVGAGLYVAAAQAGANALVPMGFAQRVVQLPPELAAAISGAIFFVLSLLLQGRLPDEYIEEIAGLLSTAIVGVIGVLLRLVPANFEDLATALLAVLVILLGMISGVKLLFAGGKRLLARFTA